MIGVGGLGHIGIECLAAMAPTEIIVFDPNEEGLALAAELGADHAVEVEGTRHIETVRAHRRPRRRRDHRLRGRERRHGGRRRDDPGRRLYYVIGYLQNITRVHRGVLESQSVGGSPRPRWHPRLIAIAHTVRSLTPASDE